MWTYEQLTGRLYDDNFSLVGVGYSGHGDGVNNPSLQSQHDVGPIPCGLYDIGKPYDSSHSPHTLALTPHPGNEMFGRSNFLIHGDLKDKPGQHEASLGCIIQSRDVREKITLSGDTLLKVVSGIVPDVDGELSV